MTYWISHPDDWCMATEDLEKADMVDASEYRELLAYCEMLENIVMERGINADFMWKAKRAMETLEKLQTLVATIGESELGDYPELSAYCRMLEDAIKGEPDNAE